MRTQAVQQLFRNRIARFWSIEQEDSDVAGARSGDLLDVDDGAVRAGAERGVAAHLAEEGELLEGSGDDEYSGRHCGFGIVL